MGQGDKVNNVITIIRLNFMQSRRTHFNLPFNITEELSSHPTPGETLPRKKTFSSSCSSRMFFFIFSYGSLASHSSPMQTVSDIDDRNNDADDDKKMTILPSLSLSRLLHDTSAESFLAFFFFLYLKS